ncbi:f6715550-6459-42fc-817e-2ed721028e18 [Thermothielavioides terrestris]|uniref:F6715550-6459-42fc-817e-2ed721028e18 n=1 Tax=Thermothielavioides terrestris TaxID=2587410 RepID=A0A3S4C7I3_9PEZI|nr:f6715550-6459-42fc-817e-2ed721028e18 [Thermothielavioides terrestris]
MANQNAIQWIETFEEMYKAH